MSDSLWPHRRQRTRLPCPWVPPGKNTGVGCHCLLQCMKVKSESEVTQSYLTLSDPMDCSLPGSSVHGIFQARVLEWGAIAFSRKLARQTKKVSCWIWNPNDADYTFDLVRLYVIPGTFWDAGFLPSLRNTPCILAAALSWDGSLVLASKFSVRQKNKGKKKILAHISLQFHVLSTTHPSTPTPY